MNPCLARARDVDGLIAGSSTIVHAYLRLVRPTARVNEESGPACARSCVCLRLREPCLLMLLLDVMHYVFYESLDRAAWADAPLRVLARSGAV